MYGGLSLSKDCELVQLLSSLQDDSGVVRGKEVTVGDPKDVQVGDGRTYRGHVDSYW